MKNTAADFKKLYEQSLKTITEKEEKLAKERQLLAQANEILSQTKETLSQTNETITEKDEKIAQLNFELEKFRRYLFGRKNEKLTPM